MNHSENLLPADGVVHLFENWLSSETEQLFRALAKEVDWKQDEVVMFGKRITMRRLTAWYGDRPFEYTYSQVSRKALPWSKTLAEIKAEVEKISGETFNSCLLNFYHNGEDYMGWHSDDEPELDPNACIASVSLGAERKFSFKHRRSKDTSSVFLNDGSLLLMKPPTQEHWLHTLRKSKKVTEGRINLTFRKMRIVP
ncbi:alpha-ketoglutarate-dependent dioxygenase AlkB [Cryomorphaceae bacterium 1068]|nr:alpha-ketoglutarate-dependent dioxygenase AlkB [Cryomorphaceae bacterium 1068]